jgi:hypothetical protein
MYQLDFAPSTPPQSVPSSIGRPTLIRSLNLQLLYPSPSEPIRSSHEPKCRCRHHPRSTSPPPPAKISPRKIKKPQFVLHIITAKRGLSLKISGRAASLYQPPSLTRRLQEPGLHPLPSPQLFDEPFYQLRPVKKSNTVSRSPSRTKERKG